MTGKAVYGLDARPKGALVAAVARCPVPGGRVRSFDASRASRVPGVRRVAGSRPASRRGGRHLQLRPRRARYPLDEGRTAPARPRRIGRRPGRGAWRLRHAVRGRRDEGVAESARRLDATYDYEFQAHAPVEPMNAADAARALHDPRRHTGAEPGQEAAAKLRPSASSPHVEAPLSAAASDAGSITTMRRRRQLSARSRRRFRSWTRQDEFENDPPSRPRSTSSAGPTPAAASGRLAPQEHELPPDRRPGYAPDDADTYEENRGACSTTRTVCQSHRGIRVAKAPVRLAPGGPWRFVVGSRASPSTRRRMPLKIHRGRLSLLEGGGVLHVGDWQIQRDRLAAVLRLAAAKSAWGEPLAPIPGRRVGRGVAANVYHGRTHVAQVAEVSVGDTGDVRVHRIVCAVDCGQIVNLGGVEGQVESGIAGPVRGAEDRDRVPRWPRPGEDVPRLFLSCALRDARDRGPRREERRGAGRGWRAPVRRSRPRSPMRSRRDGQARAPPPIRPADSQPARIGSAMAPASRRVLRLREKVRFRTRRVVDASRPTASMDLAGGQVHPGDLVRHLAGIERHTPRTRGFGRRATAARASWPTAGTRSRTSRESTRSRWRSSAASPMRTSRHCVTPGGAPITVSKWLRLMAEHEIHHRGQIYMAWDAGRPHAAAYGLTSE